MRPLLLLSAFLLSAALRAASPDSLATTSESVRFVPNAQHLGISLSGGAGRVLPTDIYQRKWLHGKSMKFGEIGVFYRTYPDETDVFAQEYNFPTFSATLFWGDCSAVTMHKFSAPDWGLLRPVDYTSDAGQLVALYGTFSRPLWCSGRWSAGYSLSEGLAYNSRPYNRLDNADNELTGSHLLVYFGASLYAQCRLAPRWSVRTDVAFRHVSNGAVDRPNKGMNVLTPTLSLIYDLDETAHFERAPRIFRPFRAHWYRRLTVSMGCRSLLEEWLQTQYATPPFDPRYRQEDFVQHVTLNGQFDVMRRYARRWASGVGIDAFWMPYVRQLERDFAAAHPDARYARGAVGIAGKHEAFYGNLSAYVSLGVYLFRRTGHLQTTDETPYYERVGVNYRFSRRLAVGVGVKAHKTKADFAELSLSALF